MLALAYRIDYLIVPEGKLQAELEKVVEIYFRKDNRPVTEKNGEMLDCFQKLAAKDRTEFYPYLFRSKHTFSIVTPQTYKTVADAIYNANQNIGWYREYAEAVVARWKEKYPELKFDVEKLKYDNAVTFNQTFTTEVEYLNLESR